MGPESDPSRLRYDLFHLIPPSGSAPVPSPFGEAEDSFTQAQCDYEAGRYSEAARGFLAAAETLKLDRGEIYWETFAANRMWAYRNAVYSWMMLDSLNEARAALEKAIAADSICADDLRQLLEELPPPPPRP